MTLTPIQILSGLRSLERHRIGSVHLDNAGESGRVGDTEKGGRNGTTLIGTKLDESVPNLKPFGSI